MSPDLVGVAGLTDGDAGVVDLGERRRSREVAAARQAAADAAGRASAVEAWVALADEVGYETAVRRMHRSVIVIMCGPVRPSGLDTMRASLASQKG